MSPASRGPRGKQKSAKASRRAALTVVRSAPEACDCPACSGDDADPVQMLDELVEGAAALVDCDDPIDAELAGALFVAMATAGAEETVPAFVQTFVPHLEARGGDTALALLTVIGSVASGVQDELAEAASAAARRLLAGGAVPRSWAGELGEPVAVGECQRLYDTDGTMSALVGSFRRAGREHAVLVVADHEDCGAAAEVFFLETGELPEALEGIRSAGRADGLETRTEALGPAEFRWYVEHALDARAEHDAEDAQDADDTQDGGPELFDEDGGPGYRVLAVLVQTRIATLPPPRKPAGAPEFGHANSVAAVMGQALSRLAAGSSGGRGGDFVGRPGGRGGALTGPLGGRAQPAKLPPKRKKSNGPAPIYQINVGLSRAEPPIWRRLLVPGDVTLVRLHGIIQAAFDWDDDHMHKFETPYGDFGEPDRELGLRSERPVTLEQVAREPGSRISYRYDFGDDWDHEILVEQVLDRDAALVYPLCTGGERAAPPEDCGGIWGYAELAEVLADPDHEEHEDRLEWLGLDDAGQFDPAAFDADKVNRRLRA